MDDLEVVPLQNPPRDDVDTVDEGDSRTLNLEPFSTNLHQDEDLAMADTVSRASVARARFQANPAVRVGKRIGTNSVKKLEDIGLGLLGVTEGIAEAGEGVGRSAVSGVGAVGSVVEAGVMSALGGGGPEEQVVVREVDTVTEVDISGTILKDLNRAIEIEQLKGTSNAESPLNTPWILMIVPMLPIVIMYTKTVMEISVPPLINAVVTVWFFVGWRIWLCLSLAIFLGVIISWETVKSIEPLRAYTMLIDVEVIKLRRKAAEETHKQMPKIHKVLDRLLPPVRVLLHALDRALTPRLGYSPLLAMKAKANGWIYDPKIKEVAVGKLHPSEAADASKTALSVVGAETEEHDGGFARIMTEDGEEEQQHAGLEYDRAATRAAAKSSTSVQGAGELFEQFFQISLQLGDLCELHRQYTSVWVEWTSRGMVVDRSVIRDISTAQEYGGFGASFVGNTLLGEVRLPMQADTTVVKGGFHDAPIRLVLKGRDGLPLYSNDGARRYMRDSPDTVVIGEIELSALKIGVGTYADGIVKSDLRIPLHAVGVSQYRAAVLHATTRIVPVDSSSYSYRQMLSPLPNGEWTVRVNVFELRNLRGVDDSGSSDPYVSTSVMGMEKSTDRQRQTLSCMVNQLLFFSKVCTGLEFEDEKIVIKVMDWNRFRAPTLIGMYTLDAKRMLELPGQELFRKWFALQDPKGGKTPAGFIKMSVTVVRPGGTLTQHDDSEDREEFSSAVMLKNTVLKPPKMSYENWAVHITIGWADMLPRMSTGTRDAIRGYITLSYSGYDECRTQTFIAEAKEVIDPNIGEACTVMPQRRVIWNEEYILPLIIINDRVAQEGIQLRLYHRTMPRLDSPMRGDLPIGQVNVSFEELFRNTATAVVRGQRADGEDEGDRIRKVAMMKPRYYNFYGMPDGEADPYDKGVAFRGRVLIGVAAKPGDIPKPYLRPCPAPPRPRLEFYKLDFCVLQATELPLPPGWSIMLEGRIGLHQFGHTIPNAVVENFCVQWDDNCTVSIPNLQFPEDVEQIPDLFITLFARKSLTVAELEERASPGQADESSGDEANSSVAADSVNGDHKDIADKHDSDLESLDRRSSSVAGPATRARAPDIGANETASADWAPKAFLRLPAKHLISAEVEPRWMFMDYPGNNVLDSDDNKVPGSILMSATLSKYDPTATYDEEDEITTAPVDTSAKIVKNRSSLSAGRESQSVISADLVAGKEETVDITSEPKQMVEPRRSSLAPRAAFSRSLGSKQSYTLRAYIVQGRNLPAADESGLSDPTVLVSMGNRSKYGEVICKQTVSPLWEEMIEVSDIKIRDGERKPNVNVLLYDYDEEDSPMQYLGRAIIPSAELDVVTPSLQFAKWYPVFSVNPGVIVGEILADFQFLPTELAIARPMLPLPSPAYTESALRISLVGLRDVKFLKFAAGDLFVECLISGHHSDREKSKRGAILQHRAYEANCNILDVLMLDIFIPDDLRLAPTLTVQVYAEYAHAPKADLIATSCINLENWLSEHERALLTGNNIIDDSFGMDSPVPERLMAGDKYKFRRDAKRLSDDRAGDVARTLHEIKAHDRSEKKNFVVLQEKAEVLRVGYADKDEKKDGKDAEKGGSVEEGEAKASDEGMVRKIFAPIRAMKYKMADVMADLMPDVAMALGVEVHEDVPLATVTGADNEGIDYDGTRALKIERGFCATELEADFSEPAYGEFLLFRGDNRSLGNTTGRMDDAATAPAHNPNIPPVLPFNEAPSHATLVKREKRRTALEGSRPAVGKIKARLDLVEVDAANESDVKNARLASLRSFGSVFVPTEVVVRVYVLRGINLQQVGSACNPYLTCRFYGGYPDFYSGKHDPILDDDNPNFFEMFESRVKMPGGSVRIEVKDRMLPEITVPVAFPKFMENSYRFGLAQQDIPVNIGKLGLGWSETVGETMIDLDSRWYNSAWRSLAKTPVEMRSLYSEESANLKGHVELFVDIFDAVEFDKRPKLYRPIPISKPKQDNFELRIVVYKIRDCYLPYQLADYDPAKLASFYVEARLGNRPEDVRKIDRPCKYVSDGVAEFNWRMKWQLKLPSLDIKPRLKLQIYDDTSFGVGDDQLCAVSDIKLRSLFDEIVTTKEPIIKKKQWVLMHHPNHPEVSAQVQISLELTTAEAAAKKKCGAGQDGYDETQHQDYILPQPFQPAAFSLYNPVPCFNYLIISSINNLQWTLACTLLIFPFIPMFMQFVFMLTPWTWYAAGGVAGLIVFIRITLVQSARAARAQAETAVRNSEGGPA